MFLGHLDIGLIVIAGGTVGYFRCRNRSSTPLIVFEIVIPFVAMFFGSLVALMLVILGLIEVAPLKESLHAIGTMPDQFSKIVMFLVSYIFGGWSGLTGKPPPPASSITRPAKPLKKKS